MLFEIRAITFDKHDRPAFLVLMDLEQYNYALDHYLKNVQDSAFNDGFRTGNNYPSEEELADMDDDRTEDHSQESDPGIV